MRKRSSIHGFSDPEFVSRPHRGFGMWIDNPDSVARALNEEEDSPMATATATEQVWTLGLLLDWTAKGWVHVPDLLHPVYRLQSARSQIVEQCADGLGALVFVPRVVDHQHRRALPRD